MGREAHNLAAMDGALTTRILATNIHCSSCVAKIEETVQRLGPSILSVSVDVVNQQITILHSNDPATTGLANIYKALTDEAFEVCSASCVDRSGNLVSELDIGGGSDSSLSLPSADWWRTALLSPGSRVVPSALLRTTSAPGATPTIASGKEQRPRRHVENCAACRGELGLEHDYGGVAASSSAAGSTVKKGDLKHLSRSTTLDFVSPRLPAVASRDDGVLAGKQKSLSSSPFAPPRASTTSIPSTASSFKQHAFHEKRVRRSSSSSFGSLSSGTLSATGDSKATRYKMEISIGGMTCSSCSNAIRDAATALDGVRTAYVDLVSNGAIVEFEGDEGFAEEVIKAIEDIGYEASITSLTPLASVPRPQDNSRNRTIKAPKKNLYYRAVLSLGGMTCASCSNAIIEGLKQLPYVSEVDVALMTNSGTVTFDGREHLDNIMERVEDLGYEVSIDSCETLVQSTDQRIQGQDDEGEVESRTVQLRIDGMFCEHCPDRVSKSLKETFPAVTIERPPTLKTPIITVTYVPQSPGRTIRDIAKAIHDIDAKFQVSPFHPPSIEERSQHLQRLERRHTLRRLILSAIAAIPTLIIGVVYMSLVPGSDPVRQYFEEPIWAGNVTRADWSMFILATPVYLFAADIFHRRTIKEIRALWRKGSRVPILRRFYRFGSMNMLISAGTTVAYFSSIVLLGIEAADTKNTPSSSTYFDSVVFLTFFILIGRCLEAYSKSKAGNAVSMLSNLRPDQALLVESQSGGTSEPTASSSSSKVGERLEKSHEEKGSCRNESSSPIAATTTKSISADFLEIGDIVIVPHGSSPPADGTLLPSPSSTVTTTFDESSLTGESRPVSKSADDSVFVGTINTSPSPVRIRVTKLGGASMLDQIVAVVREGQTRRAPVERVVDMVTGYFVPVITLLAVITFFVWFALGQSGVLDQRYLAGHSGGWAFWALEFAVAVFVVACPCGIGLAAPTALFVGGGLAARKGILVRGGGEAFQEASDLDAVVFDKTGTLTEGGDLRVTDHEVLMPPTEGLDEAEIWSIARVLEENSGHPIAKAVVAFTTEQTGGKMRSSISLVDVQETPGLGLRGEITFSPSSSSRSTTYEAAIGSETLIAAEIDRKLLAGNTFAAQRLSAWKTQAKSVVVLAIRPKLTHSSSDPSSINTSPAAPWTVAAVLATADPLRPSAAPTVSSLQGRGIAVYMLSGDNPTTAAAVAAQVGIPAANVFAGVLPAQKAEKIRWLQEKGPRKDRRKMKNAASRSLVMAADNPSLGEGDDSINNNNNKKQAPPSRHQAAKIAFVGDGINDAPALLASTVSISLATGSPIALTSSSFVLVHPSLESIVSLLDLSRRVFRRIRLNFAWALAYNLVLVPVAAGVLFRARDDGWRLGPVWAAAAMALSSVSVVLSSLALRIEWRGAIERAWKSARPTGGPWRKKKAAGDSGDSVLPR